MIVILIWRFYESLHAFQQLNYRYQSYLGWLRRNWTKRIIYLSLLLFLIDNVFLHLIVFSILLGYNLYFFQKPKKRIVLTKRLLRLVTILIGFSFIGLFNYKWLVLMSLITEAFVLISNIILFPLEKFISSHYINLSKKKLASFDGKKIAITGSYGKTSTKDYLSHFLSRRYLSLKTPYSYNTAQGISKTINASLNKYYDFFIMEFGAKRTNDIKELNEMFTPNIAIITNIGYQHLESFGTVDKILEEKAKIAKNCELVFVNANDELLLKHFSNQNVFFFGIDEGDYQARNACDNPVAFDFYYKDKFITKIQTRVYGYGNISNILSAISVSYHLGIDITTIERESAKLKNYDHRLSIKRGLKTILDDSFNSNIIGALQALSILSKQEGKQFVITPGFVELGFLKDNHHIEFAKEIKRLNITPILVGNNPLVMIKELKKYYAVKNFHEGMKLYNNLTKGTKSALLIENDLPDYY